MVEIFLFLATDPPSLKLWRDKFRRYLWHKFTRIFWMQVLKCAGCAGVATGSTLRIGIKSKAGIILEFIRTLQKARI